MPDGAALSLGESVGSTLGLFELGDTDGASLGLLLGLLLGVVLGWPLGDPEGK